MAERAGAVPVFRPNVATRISWYAATVDDDTQNDEPGTCDDLDDGEHKLDLTVTPNAKHLDDNQRDEEYGDPDAHVLLCRFWPEVERETGGGKLEGQDGEPLNRIIPSSREAPRRIDEADGILEESTVDREQDPKFRQRLHGDQQHGSNDAVADDQGRGAAGLQRCARADEETGTDSTACELVRIYGDGRPTADGDEPIAIICICRPFRERCN